MKYGIVVIGYNRCSTIRRLLDKLNEAEYFGDEVLLIISIDKSDVKEVYTLANEFEWKHGDCVKRFHEEKMGLRNHVLKCGGYMEEYDLDAIAVFEDDIYPSPAFYNYMKQAVEQYQNSNLVAGISLYTHLWNADAELPFQPDYNGKDAYFLRYAPSWGQIWMRKQWNAFISWYETYQGTLTPEMGIPENACKWPESSWLKYHITYCIANKKYFVYPYEALATCFNEVGTHTEKPCNIFQVPIVQKGREKYSFPEEDNIQLSYDAFYEREQVSKWLKIPSEDICIDLYGRKAATNNKRYLLTTKRYPYKIVKSYGMQMRPHEVNILENIPGTDIILYDLQERDKLVKTEIDAMVYYFRIIRSKFWFMKYGFFSGIKKLMRILNL